MRALERFYRHYPDQPRLLFAHPATDANFDSCCLTPWAAKYNTVRLAAFYFNRDWYRTRKRSRARAIGVRFRVTALDHTSRANNLLAASLRGRALPP
jgi:hypothetical protein